MQQTAERETSQRQYASDEVLLDVQSKLDEPGPSSYIQA